MNLKYYNLPNDFHKLNSIQGGKMTHIFNYTKINNNNLYLENNFTSDEAKKAFYNGIWTIKFHGSNGFITKENNIIKLWERRDIKNKNLSEIKDEFIELNYINHNNNYNKTVLPDEYQSNEKKHKYIFIKIDTNTKKWKILYPRMEKLLNNIDTLYQSIEYVGKKIQGNEKQFNWNNIKNHDYGIVFHSSVIYQINDFSFVNLIDIAKNLKIEGWVIYHNNKAWKIRTNMLVPDNLAAFDKKNESDCKPFVF